MRVLHTIDFAHRSMNPYISELLDQLASQDCTILHWSWRTALLGSYDILHVHWPEKLFRSKRIYQPVKYALFVLLLLRLRLTGSKVVWTAHNLQPHENGSKIEILLIKLFKKSLSSAITLNSTNQVSTLLEDRIPVMTILHPQYAISQSRIEPEASPEPNRMLLFGLLRPYKGIEQLLKAFQDLTEEDAELHIAGAPSDRDYERDLRRMSESIDHVFTTFEFLTEDQLMLEIQRCQLVVLPYKNMFNSGAALLALSADRPILVPKNDSTDLLAAEVGKEWVQLYTGPISAQAIIESLHETSKLTGYPNLSRRTWEKTVALHLHFYSRIIENR
jgi:beta-1,4-mannosyltransferase